jgi:hypothetical protein
MCQDSHLSVLPDANQYMRGIIDADFVHSPATSSSAARPDVRTSVVKALPLPMS